MTKNNFQSFSDLENFLDKQKTSPSELKQKDNSSKLSKTAPHKSSHAQKKEAEEEAIIFMQAMQGTAKLPSIAGKVAPAQDENFADAFGNFALRPLNSQKKHKTKSKITNIPDLQEQKNKTPEDQSIAMQGHEQISEEDQLFAKATKGVSPMIAKGRDVPKAVEKKTNSLPDNPNFLADFLLGKIEFDIRNTEEYVEGFVVGIDPLVLGKLQAGGYSPEAHLDLHGQNGLQAQDSLMIFIKNAYYRNMRTLLVITGRGKNSPNGLGVLRADLQDWLTKEPFKRVVLAFCTARPCDGGAGAIYVLLRKFKKSSGKIRWERSPNTEDFI